MQLKTIYLFSARNQPLTEAEILDEVHNLDNSDIDELDPFDDDDSVIDRHYEPNYGDLESSDEEGKLRNDEDDQGMDSDEEIMQETTDDGEEESQVVESEKEDEPETTTKERGKISNKGSKNVKARKKKQKPKKIAKWGKGKLVPDFPDYPSVDYDVGQRQNWLPIDYFSEYYGDDFYVLLASQTNIYYLQQREQILNRCKLLWELL